MTKASIRKSFAIFIALLVLAIFGVNVAFSEEPPKQDQAQQETVQDGSEKSQNELLKQEKTVSNESSGEAKKQEDRKKALNMLFQKDFRYSYISSLNSPLIPFLKPPQAKVQAGQEQLEDIPPPPVLITPLQKMELSEIERGFKGVVWSSNERKAIIEDSTGKGYIVTVGTPIGNQDGFISAIFPDRIVIRQKVWDKTSKTFKDEDVVISLRK